MNGLKKYWLSCLCFGVSFLFFLAMRMNRSSAGFSEYPYLERAGYGQGESLYSVIVTGLCEEPVFMELTVQDRIYSKEETEQVWQQGLSRIQGMMLGENEGLGQVKRNLNLPDRLEEYGIELNWRAEDRSVVNEYGELFEDGIPQGVTKDQTFSGIQTSLFVEMSDEVRSREYEIPVTVFLEEPDESERLETAFKEKIKQLDIEGRETEGLLLPAEYEGKMLEYGVEEENDEVKILVLGAIGAVLLLFKDKEDERKRLQNRNKQMILDYSEIISKFQVLLGAGMTAGNAWERVVLDYESMTEKGTGRKREAYEEMKRTYYQMKSGKSEGEAYREFGRRCCLQPYMKLGSLLEQNRRTGTKNLRQLLDAEVQEAFEQRKHLAKRMGEEASTRLLLPLFLMLGIVMVIIAAPAVMTLL